MASFLLHCWLSLFATILHPPVLKSPLAQGMNRCEFNSLYIFGEGSSSISNGLVMTVDEVASAFNLTSPHPYKEAPDFMSGGANFAAPGATVMKIGFFNRIMTHPPPMVETSLESQIDEFLDLVDARLIMPYQERVEKLRGALFFIDQPAIADYRQAFSQGESPVDVSESTPPLVTTIINQLRRLIRDGASNLLVSGLPRLGSLQEFRELVLTPDMLDGTAIFHNRHLQQALVELKLEFPEVHIVYSDYYNMDETGFTQSALEFAKSRDCDYFRLGH